MKALLFALVALVGLAAPGIAAAQFPVYSSVRVGPFGRVHAHSSVGLGVPVAGFGVRSYGLSPFAVTGYHPAAFGVSSYGYVPLSFGAFAADPCQCAPVAPVAPPAAFGSFGTFGTRTYIFSY